MFGFCGCSGVTLVVRKRFDETCTLTGFQDQVLPACDRVHSATDPEMQTKVRFSVNLPFTFPRILIFSCFTPPLPAFTVLNSSTDSLKALRTPALLLTSVLPHDTLGLTDVTVVLSASLRTLYAC